jgi:hypothetical protein
MDYWTQMMWRPAFNEPQIASYAELRYQWTLNDLLECCELMAYHADRQKEYQDSLPK